MAQIQILSPHTADLIAAGEVVERPASAVKELLENAVDAGARTIVAEIRGGGRESIRITDDGSGMAPEDAGVCFLRHATSKLRDARGLEAIGTLGFRGEALAAISSVSRITLSTRLRGAQWGVRMEVTAGEIDTMEETGCPEGTTILVRELFYNTPARLKFLGSDRAEGAACVQAALRCALGRPDVSIRCLRDGQEEFFAPGDGREDSCVYALLGRDFAAGLLPVATENDGVSVTGFVSAPGFCRGNRSAQHFFCNGRPIRSRTLQAALEQAYKNTAMVGKFPACVLYIRLSPGLVDVNVHPTKAEVKFAREKAVFDGVYYGVLAALGLGTAPAGEGANVLPAQGAVPGAPLRGRAATRPDFFRQMDEETFRKAAGKWETATLRDRTAEARPRRSGAAAPEPGHRREPPLPGWREPRSPGPGKRDGDALSGAADTFRPPVPEEIPEPAPLPPRPETDIAPETDAVQEAGQTVLDESFREEPPRLIGEALGVYILLEQAGRLLVIDKHAAHERILFDRMRLNDRPVMSQELLAPETYSPGGEDGELLAENLPLLARLGFRLEPFGEGAFILRAVPADTDPAEAVPLLEELTDKLRQGRKLDAGDVWERLAETVACRGAVKGGDRSTPEELEALARQVLSGQVRCCPHGRPVCAVFTREELDRKFGRIP